VVNSAKNDPARKGTGKNAQQAHKRTDLLTGNKHSLRVGWRNFFPVVLLYQFFGFWQEIGFVVTCLRI
jgi:hypothetical protein